MNTWAQIIICATAIFSMFALLEIAKATSFIAEFYARYAKDAWPDEVKGEHKEVKPDDVVGPGA